MSPYDADSQVNFVKNYDLIRARTASNTAFNNGKMNGVYQEQVTGQAHYPNLIMAYYTGYNTTVPNHWDLASYYALNTNFYSGRFS